MKKLFDNYVKNYKQDDGITLKINHSKRVSKINKDLATKLGLNKEDIKVAEIIGLFHDIGRFDEWKEYNTYKNYKFDHGEHGVKVLKSLNFNHKEKDLIYDAIYNHNKLNIKDNSDKQIKLIRDADKIDIYYLHTKKDLGDYNKEVIIKEKVKKDFFLEKSISHKDVDTKSEYMILSLALIYDINFKESLILIKEKNYLKDLEKKLNSSIYNEYFIKINDYIEKRIQNDGK